MTIDEYIERHELRHVGRWPAVDNVPALLVEPPGEVFDIYRNATSTHFVSLNRTHQKFRIFHNELVPFFSDWFASDQDYTGDDL